MKELVLLRHAQARPSAGAGDFHRPLTVHGHVQARQAAAALAAADWIPDALLCSPAIRTQETAFLLAANLQQPPVIQEPLLLHASAALILEALRALPDDMARILVVGHNPGISECIHTLLPPAARCRALRTGAWHPLQARLQAWRQLAPGTAVNGAFAPPLAGS